MLLEIGPNIAARDASATMPHLCRLEKAEYGLSDCSSDWVAAADGLTGEVDDIAVFLSSLTSLTESLTEPVFAVTLTLLAEESSESCVSNALIVASGWIPVPM